MARVYVASSWRNKQQPEVVARLRAEGHEVYDFRNPAPGDSGFGWRQVTPEPPPWSAEKTREVLTHPVADRGFRLDIGALRWCEACVMVQPCGRSAALELGYAAGAGKVTAVLLADGQEPELMLKVADRICVSLDEVVAFLAGKKFSIYDIEDSTYHAGGGEWVGDRERAETYPTRKAAEAMLEEVDCEDVLRDRLVIKEHDA